MKTLTLNIKEVMTRPLPRILVSTALLALVLAAAFNAYGKANRGQSLDDTTAAVRNTHWGDNVTITFEKGYFRYQANSRPNHALNAEYIMPDNFTSCVPQPTTKCSHIEPVEQAVVAVPIDVKIPTRPQKVAETSSTSFGAMGVLISGSPVYNPFEGDGVTVAMNANFTLPNSKGQLIPFMDDCHGHPAPHPREQYHYHGLPPCVTAQIDQANGPSHIIGFGFDGFPIYGDRDINGKLIYPQSLDDCNGITSPTPEFPQGIYHYVLLNVPTVQSTVRCLHGKLDAPLAAYQWQLP
jgi:hypothetical protein